MQLLLQVVDWEPDLLQELSHIVLPNHFQGLNYELKDKIDVLSFECGRTDTKFMKTTNRKGLLQPSLVEAGCLRDIGKESITYGTKIHEQ